MAARHAHTHTHTRRGSPSYNIYPATKTNIIIIMRTYLPIVHKYKHWTAACLSLVRIYFVQSSGGYHLRPFVAVVTKRKHGSLLYAQYAETVSSFFFQFFPIFFQSFFFVFTRCAYMHVPGYINLVHTGIYLYTHAYRNFPLLNMVYTYDDGRRVHYESACGIPTTGWRSWTPSSVRICIECVCTRAEGKTWVFGAARVGK